MASIRRLVRTKSLRAESFSGVSIAGSGAAKNDTLPLKSFFRLFVNSDGRQKWQLFVFTFSIEKMRLSLNREEEKEVLFLNEPLSTKVPPKNCFFESLV